MNKRLYQKALDELGECHQLTVAMEELSELAKEICKYLRDIGDTSNIAEEVADVEIICDELRFIFKFDDEVNHWKKYKLKRLEKRLKD